jgi:hypothetical protein
LADSRNTRIAPANQSDSARKMHMAWDAYAAMRHAEVSNPKLKKNPLWQTLRDDAFGEFQNAFGGAE